MCRFIAYHGQSKGILKEFLFDMDNALVKQSYAAQMDNDRLNPDGFGVAWYERSIDQYPAILRSVSPAWNDENLRMISPKVRSDCFLAHVRASTSGAVNIHSCHPFIHDKYAFMHNGSIGGFHRIKKRIIAALSNEYLDIIKSQVDSEYLFALVLHNLNTRNVRYADGIADAVQESFEQLIYWQSVEGVTDGMKANIIISNGSALFATRFSTAGLDSLSLYSYQSRQEDIKGKYMVISSEPLDAGSEEWVEVKENTGLFVHSQGVQENELLPIVMKGVA